VTKIAVFGAKGRIGSCALSMLQAAGREAHGFDVGEHVARHFNHYDVFLAAVPYHACLDIAWEVSRHPGKVYLDLTEDVAAGVEIRDLMEGSGSIAIPHCGLAPGAISILADSMLPAHTVTMRVGALPLSPPDTHLKYAINWSTEGLVNEYVKTPYGLRDGQQVALVPMGDLVTVLAHDRLGEAFNTSGGIGTFLETRAGEVQNATYQTIRHSGHCRHMRFLLNELGLKYAPKTLVKILDYSLPRNVEDQVLIEIHADEVTAEHRILGAGPWSAIQRATAAGVVGVLEWVIDHPTEVVQRARDGCWLANEDVKLSEVSKYASWRSVYGRAA
jgi:saccharopine dehydrogenase-like NADP-dependent oxidoreductase